jgi:hypothetical protein
MLTYYDWRKNQAKNKYFSVTFNDYNGLSVNARCKFVVACDINHIGFLNLIF